MQRRQGKKVQERSAPPQQHAEHVLDLRGMIMPLTLLKITQRLRKIGTGETMEILATDPDTRRDLLKILQTAPCEVLRIIAEKEYYLIRLRKRKGRRCRRDGEKSNK